MEALSCDQLPSTNFAFLLNLLGMRHPREVTTEVPARRVIATACLPSCGYLYIARAGPLMPYTLLRMLKLSSSHRKDDVAEAT